jgi:Leucine Rich repeats (2 copies)
MNYNNWWNGLSNEWKTSFNEVVFRKGEITTQPIDAEIELLLLTKILRFAGPTAPYPNMKTVLKDLSGLAKLQNLETLVVINHNIKAINELENLTNLKSIFVYENKIESLIGVENLNNLTEIYFHSNKIKSLKPLEKLVNLEKIYASNNLIENLEGITEAHSYKLKNFHVLPNENLSDRDIIKFENTMYIKCLKG